MKTMIRLAVGLSCLMAASAVLTADAVSKEEIQALAKQIETDADTWLAGKVVEVGPEGKLRSISYDAQTVDLLLAQLSAGRKDPVNLYVANLLISPLLMAKDEVVAKALPSLLAFRDKAGKYNEMPELSAAQLAALKETDGSATATSGPSTQPSSAASKLQEAKLAKERPLALHNQQLYLLEQNLAVLLLYGNDKKFDQQLLDLLKEAIAQQSWTYTDILSALRQQAGKMGQERAKVFYDALVELGDEHRLDKKVFRKLGMVKLEPADNSVIPQVTEYTGQRLVDAANILASAARQPAHKVPTKAEIDKANAKPSPGAATPKPAPNPTPKLTGAPVPDRN